MNIQADRANPAQVQQHIARQRYCVRTGKLYRDTPRPVELVGSALLLVVAFGILYARGATWPL